VKYFFSSFIVSILGLGIAFYLGGFGGLYIAALLAILEVSLSFDNAVVNAKVLDTMEPVWQKRFIIFGIPVAVFGMRFLFPIVIVAIASNLGVMETFQLAVDNPEHYHETLEKVKNLIYAFGGAFLLMVFLDFLFDEERDEKWLKFIEDNLIINKLAGLGNTSLMFSMGIGLYLIHLTQDISIAIAYFSGILLHSFIASLDDLFSTDGVRSGIVGLIYLEILDASFSFDGVIGAFALSSDIFIIMIGLGIGAMFVRSLTIYLVEKKTLAEFIYLEHGAHYAIFALAFIMFYKMFHEIDEVIVGTIGVALIGISALHSLKVKKDKE